MKVYIAAALDNKNEALRLREELWRHGHTITSRWLDSVEGESAEERALDSQCHNWATRDIVDIYAADMLVLLSGGRSTGGRHVELGIALNSEMRLVLIGTPSNIFERAYCEKYDTIADFIAGKQSTYYAV